MKRAFFFIVIYILTLLLLTAVVSLMILLYPGTPGTAAYVDSFERVADIFLYSFFTLLPLTSVLSLLVIVFTVAKRGSSSLLDFLVYVFLCCAVWLLIIPCCFLYEPAAKISFFITGLHPSPAASFFQKGFSYAVLRGYDDLYLRPPPSIAVFFSKLVFAESVVRSAVDAGRFPYLITASAGLAFSALYAFYSFSKWKLMNAALVIVLSLAVSILNIYMYMPEFSVFVHTEWFPLIVNAVVCFLFCIIPLTRALIRAKTGTEEVK